MKVPIMLNQKLMLASALWLIVLVSTNVHVESATLPNFIKPCRRQEPAFETCLIDLLNGIRERLPRGMRELRIRPLDPLELPIVNFGSESDFITSIEYAIFHNITVTGSSNFTVRNLTIDWETPKMTVDIDFLSTRIICNYNISASTLYVPVSSDGYFEGNFTNVSSHNILYGEYYNKDGKKFVKIINQVVSLDIGNSDAHLEDTGNPLKNVLMNDFWSTLLSIIKPKAEVKIGEIAVSLIEEMLETYDLDSLVPK